MAPPVSLAWDAGRLAPARQRLERLRGWRADLAALVFGALAAAALPPVFALPVLLISVPALLVLVGATPNAWVAARRGWWFSFGNNLIGLYWITEAILFEAARYWWFVPLAVPALAATLALFVAFATGMARLAAPGWPRLLTLAGVWVLGDLARQFVGTGFPWNLWGSVWEFPGALGDVLMQPASLVSIHGLTFATILLAGLPMLAWGWRAGGFVLLAGWAGFGLFRLAPAPPPGPGIQAVLVQGDIQQGQKWSPALAYGIFEKYLELTRRGVAEAGAGRKIVIWPETAAPYLIGRDADARAAIVQATGGAPALVGAVRFDTRDRPRNSLFALEGNGTIAAVYDKWHLVPFGEYQPDWFPLPIQVVPGGGFAPGPGPRTLRVARVPSFGPFICYEAIFPGQVIDDAAGRPRWMVNITNDAWFGNSTGPRQHLAAARMRAVEEGLPLLRAANTGISAAFDARGHELARLGLNRAATLVVPIPGALAPTLFARVGLPLPAGIGALATIAGLIAGRGRSRPSKKR